MSSKTQVSASVGVDKAFVLQDAKVIGKMISVCLLASNKLAPQIHVAAAQCVMHAQAHGDITLLDRLVTGLHESVNVSGLRMWVSMFTPIRWNNRDGKIGLIKRGSPMRKSAGTYDMEGLKVTFDEMGWAIEAANANPYWTLQPVQRAQAPRKFDEDALIKAIFQNAAKVSDSLAVGTFTGESARAQKLLAAFEADAREAYGDAKVDAIKAEVEAAHAAKMAAQTANNTDAPANVGDAPQKQAA
jgi:hypothetical protein